LITRLFPPQHDKGHGRLETRTIALATSRAKTSFPYIEQAFRIERIRIDLKTGRETSETAFGITSLSSKQASAARLLDLNRGHWSIENESHYVRDVTFDEDRSRIRKKAGPQVMATLRNIVLSLLRLLGIDNIAKAIREFAWGNKNRVLRVIGIV
jgi:predicted transposase YbfD/YdcC